MFISYVTRIWLWQLLNKHFFSKNWKKEQNNYKTIIYNINNSKPYCVDDHILGLPTYVSCIQTCDHLV